MALNGSFYNYVYQQFGVYCEWAGSQSITGNYTDVLLKVYASYWTLNIDTGTRTVVININGTSTTFDSPPIHDMSGGSHKKVLLASKTVRVQHNSDGTKPNVSLSATWNCKLTYHDTYYSSITATDTVTLTAIDRSAPTVACSISNITANGFSISATASVTSDRWEYSTDDGTNWTQFSTDEGTTASTTVSGLAPNTTYQVKVRARKKSNQVYGTTAATAVTTLGGSILTVANETAIDVSSPAISFSVTVYNSTYYHRLTVKNGSTTVFYKNLGRYSAGTNQAKTFTLSSSQRTSMLNQIPNATAFTATFELTSYSDSGYSTQIGNASSLNALMSTSEAVSQPTFTAFTYCDDREKTAAATENDQVLIAGYSKLKVIATAGTAKNGSSISSYAVEIGDVSKSFSETTMDVGIVNTSGELALTVSCTDSRGYSTSVSVTVLSLSYVKPRVYSSSIHRTNQVEDTISLSFSGSFSPIKADGETDTNSLLYVGYYYKKTSESTWSSFVSVKSSVTVSSNYFSFSTAQLLLNPTTPLSLDTDSSYDFRLLVRDELDYYTSCDLYFVIPQGTPLVSLRKADNTHDIPRVGINKSEPESALDVNGNIKMNGLNVVGYVSTLDSSTNLNNVTEPGVYSQPQNGNASTSLNYPAAKAGILEVLSEPSGHVLQRYTAYDLSGIYVRYRFLNSWRSWKSYSIS